MFTPPMGQGENELSLSNTRPLLPCGAYFICARRCSEYGVGSVRWNTVEGNAAGASSATTDAHTCPDEGQDLRTLPDLSVEGPPPFFTESESLFNGGKGRDYYLLMNKNATAYEDKREALHSTQQRQHEHGHLKNEGWSSSVFGSSLFSTFGSYVGGGLALAGGAAASALTNISRSAVLLSEDACTTFYVEDVLTARGVAKTCNIDTSPQHTLADSTAGQQARHVLVSAATGDNISALCVDTTSTVERIQKPHQKVIGVRFDEANESVVGREEDAEGDSEWMRSASQSSIIFRRREEGRSETQTSSDSERKGSCRTHRVSPQRYCFRIAHESAASTERRGGATFLCWDTNRFERSLNLGPWESFELHSVVETIPVTRQAALDALSSPTDPNVHFMMPASGYSRLLSHPPHFTFFIYSPSYDAYLRCDPNSYSWNKISLVKKDALTHDDAWYFIPAP